MKAEVKIEKSFDNGKKFNKEYEQRDFFKFFRDEGLYLDCLCATMENKGKTGESFTVTYTVTVTK